VPILSLKPAEMAAIEELPEKDKNLILPLIPLKRWATTKVLNKSLERVKKAIGNRKWIIDLDKSFLFSLKSKTEKQWVDAFDEFQELANPKNGYGNWVSFIKEREELLPTIQFGNIDELKTQLVNMIALERTIVARFEMSGAHPITPSDFNSAIKIMRNTETLNNLYIILDYGDIDRINLLEYSRYSELINSLHRFFPKAVFSVSGTSFPYSFAGSYRGEIPIYERQIHNKIVNDCTEVKMIYSDRGSTRAGSIGGGGGSPPPRIDYPLKNDWRFIRKEFDDRDKELLYQEAAIELIKSEFWNNELHLWGTQMIEKTSLGDSYGITSPSRATAVRINIHLYQQLHYLEEINQLDTEEAWED
jgi:hypothetical protein